LQRPGTVDILPGLKKLLLKGDQNVQKSLIQYVDCHRISNSRGAYRS
jgi:hypothetical protein